VSYDPDQQILWITLMADGITRPYGNVPRWVFDELLVAESKGRFYNRRIKTSFPLLV
jgi:hypothetical protein